METEFLDQVIDKDDITKLLNHFVKTSHRVKNADIKGETIMEKCILLFSKDYKFTIVPNLNGELCGHYPMKLVIIEFERDTQSSTELVESKYYDQNILQKMKNARCARCRSRFVVPVIFFQGKHICRSATLSGGPEMFGRSTTDYLMSNQNESGEDVGKTDMFDKFRGHDIHLLKFFQVGYICDLMVEKKKTKFGMPVSSSEKVDKENRYSDFSILGMPYPGCEFFKEWKDSSYMGENIMYDWSQALNDSSLDLPSSALVDDVHVDWSKYKEWSLVELTQNYMKLLLEYIKKGKSGLLVHCISGWDRTPLFISLLRLSLWADGAIHKSLSALEILYLTLGYDWYLFGHDLPDRLNNDQEVLYFCFKVLKDISSDDFSVLQSTPSSHDLTASSPPIDGTSQARAANHSRADSESSFHEVLLECMSYGKGSCTSLSSMSSSEANEQINFSLGIQEEDEKDSDDEFQWSRTLTLTRRSASPLRAASPRTDCSSPRIHCSSPINVRCPSSDSQQLSIKSNHFVSNSLARPSSPMLVPQRAEQINFTHSIGSWQIISSSDNVPGNTSQSDSSNDRASHISSCQEAVAMNVSSLRWKRLDMVCQLFDTAYVSAVHSQPLRQSSGNGISSLFGRIAEQVGLRAPNNQGATYLRAARHQGAAGSTRTGF